MEKDRKEIQKDGSQKNVKSVFNEASVGTVGSAAKWLAQLVVWPTAKYQLPIYFAFILGVGPLTGMMFPKAEEFLENENIDPTIMEDLGVKGESINVRQFNTIGSIHQFTTMPNLPVFIFNNISRKNRDVDGYAEFTNILAFKLIAGCRVTVPNVDKEYDMKDALDVSDRQNRLHTIFHELRHCSPDNKAMDGFSKEVDADYYGALATAKVTKDKDFMKKEMYIRARHKKDLGYNNSLYFDAKLNDKPVPSITNMRRANNEFNTMYDNGCVVMGDEINPLTKRRVELFLEARDFITLNLLDKGRIEIKTTSRVEGTTTITTTTTTTKAKSKPSKKKVSDNKPPKVIRFVEKKAQCKI